MDELKFEKREKIKELILNTKNILVKIIDISYGGTDFAVMEPKDVLCEPIKMKEPKIILVHNHPSNSLKASKADIQFSNVMNKLLETFDIEFLDHIIVAEDGYLSMMKEEQIDLHYTNDSIDFFNIFSLYDENNKLKEEKTALLEQISKMQTKVAVAESEEEIEI